MDTPGILLIDDEPDVLDVMCEVLDSAGYFPMPARGSQEALHVLRSIQVDLIVSDIMMPGLDGLALLDIVKRHAPGVEVVLVTGYAASLTVQQAWARGACGFLEKPFSADALLDAVQQGLWRGRLRQGTWPVRFRRSSLPMLKQMTADLSRALDRHSEAPGAARGS